MDINVLVNAISTVGFPIACVFFLWQYVNTTMKEFTQTMNENNKMLSKLIDKIDDIGKGNIS